MNKNKEVIHLHHGSGGEHMTKLLNEVIFKILKNDILEPLDAFEIFL